MCKWGSSVLLNVPIPAHLSHTREFRWAMKSIDSCIAPIIQALNAGGVYTSGCCCGHTGTHGTISLHDGRELFVNPVLTPVLNPHPTDAEGGG